MISRLRIRNFRRNKELEIRFGRITVIRGSSAKGKSSMMGALKWLAFNQPTGDRFINWDSSFALVKARVDNHTIIRKRSGKNNYYKLDGKVYKAIGTNVPADIAKVLNLSSINFHRQHAGPFWFCKTAGEVSRELNSIVNLDVIDSTLANLAKMQRETRIQVKDIIERRDEAQSNKNEVRFVLGMDKQLRHVELSHKRAEEIAQEALTLSNLLRTGEMYRIKADRLREKAREGRNVLAKAVSYAETAKQRKEIQTLIEEADCCQRILSVTIPNITPLEALYDIWIEAKRQRETLGILIDGAEQWEQATSKHQKEAERKQKQFDKLMGKKCVLCGNQIKTS